MDFENLLEQLEIVRLKLVSDRERITREITTLEECAAILRKDQQESRTTLANRLNAHENSVPDTKEPTRKDQKTKTCPDCDGPCSPTALRCRKCHRQQDRRHVRFSAFNRPNDQQPSERENALKPIGSAAPRSQSEPDEKEPEPEVFRMHDHKKQREDEGRQASQRLKDFKQAARATTVAKEPRKASCGVCVIRSGENGLNFLAKQPDCPEHGHLGRETDGARLASSLEGVR